MSPRSNVRSLLLLILTIICASRAAYTIESFDSALPLNGILTSISNPSLASGTSFFVNAQTDAGNNLLLGYYNLSTSATANSGTAQTATLTSNAVRVAASGDYVGLAYADTNGNIFFRLLQSTGTGNNVFTTVNTKSFGAGTVPWIGVHPNGWIVAYITSGNAIALASFDLTSGNALKTATADSSASLLSLGTSSTGTSFVISYNKAESLTNNLRVQVCSMDATGTFTLPSSISLGQGSTFNTVTSRASIAPNGVALVSYIKPSNSYYAYVIITGGTPSSETVLQSSTTANSHVISLRPNLFVALWEASNAIKGAVIPADGTASTQFSVIGSGANSPAVTALGDYHFVIGWAAAGSTVRSVTQHWAIQYCGDGFVTKNEACDSGPYCQADCTCPSGQGSLGTGCTAPGVPFSLPPPSPPTDTPVIAPPVNQSPTSTSPSGSAPTVTNTPSSTPVDPNQPNAVQNITTPSPDTSQTPSQTPLNLLDTEISPGLTVANLIVIIIVPTVVIAAAIALLVVLLQRRKRRKGGKSGPFQGGDNGPTQYDQIYVNSSTLDAEPMDISRFTVDERLHIRYSELQFLKEIGSGAFGKVFIGEWQKTKVALKLNMMAQGTEFEKEARLMVTMRPHPNVVQLYGISTDGPNPVMIIEFCEGGSLDTKLYKARVNLALKSQLQLISGIAKGLLHLHRNKIVHRDLAARNILLAHGRPKISDFGMSRQLEGVSKAGQTKNAIGPVRWMAPESLSDLSYSPQSDVWSFGCVIYEIIAQQEPHANSDVLTIGIKIRDNGYTPPLPKRVDPFIKKLLKNIWQKDPAKRPTMEQLATTIDDYLAKIEEKASEDSSTTPSPIEASALDKSIHDEPSNNIGQSSEYDNIKENISAPGKHFKKGKSPRREVHSSKKQPKHEKQHSQQKMIQGDDAYDVINTSNQFKMEPIAEVPNSESSSSSSSSSEVKYHPVQVPKVPPRNKPSTPQRSLPPVPPRNSQTYNNNFTDDGAYDEVPK